ncbi:metallophosphoesterase [Aggregicoccus sp. 17bor-14]|nr:MULTISPECIES: metallophosphoesterase [Myxococcaceae]MBF5044544.1 metallophosphoesterase [Simulacricoccus sp. 17bor-14]MRI90289.1 metallophosphoesterase [Aggregicoccus sp. 17bor-14]
MLLGLLLPLGVLAALHYYIGARLLSAPHVPQPWAGLGWALLALLGLSIPGGAVATRRRGSRAARAIYLVGIGWLGAFGLLLTGALLAQFGGALLSLAGVAAGARAQALAVALGVPAALVVGFATAHGRARVERLRVPMPNLGAGLAGARIVQISDIHIGPTLDRHFLRRVVEQVNALQPDLVAVTGDLVDGSVEALRDEVAPLAGLRAPLGVYFVTGNHEYYSGGAAWSDEVRRLGLTVLQNAHRVVERGGARLTVAGVTDYNAGHIDPAHESRPDLALAGAPAGVPRVLLAHQPRTAEQAQGLGVDLQLSGHTHGGQMFPFMFFVRLQQPVVRGLATLFGTRVYTSRGTGYWGPPLRLGPAPEITELTLVPAA